VTAALDRIDDERWLELVEARLDDDGELARLLVISAPVSAARKLPVLERLADERRWHDAIASALWFAILEDDGDVDVPRARALAATLRPPIAVSELQDVRALLDELPDDASSWRDWCDRPEGPAGLPHLASGRALHALERRARERRRTDGDPPAGIGERRVSPDRRR
jgi:hypothetical protein